MGLSNQKLCVGLAVLTFLQLTGFSHSVPLGNDGRPIDIKGNANGNNNINTPADGDGNGNNNGNCHGNCGGNIIGNLNGNNNTNSDGNGNHNGNCEGNCFGNINGNENGNGNENSTNVGEGNGNCVGNCFHNVNGNGNGNDKSNVDGVGSGNGNCFGNCFHNVLGNNDDDEVCVGNCFPTEQPLGTNGHYKPDFDVSQSDLSCKRGWEDYYVMPGTHCAEVYRANVFTEQLEKFDCGPMLAFDVGICACNHWTFVDVYDDTCISIMELSPDN